ncbi:MAG: hypothetical protein WBZ24_00525 [Anaerolineales bacterium]|jgi:hypothetical protein
MQDYEKLGVFYLGKRFDVARSELLDELVLYDSRDLVTHALCVGMTGSGKTGLGIDLLEEAAIDGIPAIVIDPKGDLTNLMLTFPDLKPEDFQPWVNPDDARKKDLTLEAFAAQQADLWKKGLESWGESGERIAKLKQAAEFAIYTPGSSIGLSVSVLKSFDVPEAAILDDSELLQDRISSTVSGLLGLMGIDADPIQSREHILLSTLISHAWDQGEGLDIAGLIEGVQNPPFEQVGVLKLEDFYPSKDRFGLVMALNNLLAAPGFSAWLEGQPLDVGGMLHSPEGKPRVAIFSIAHLNDAERMFFVTLLLNHVLGWIRTQSGTTSLRAMLYMDEIFGFFPPVANPPSKAPLLALLKQARAFGLGVVLATQNPVDLDYKGLANIGTWFVGRLQTERDRDRLMDGLLSAQSGAAFDRKELEKLLAGLESRTFLMNNVHDAGPVVFQTRWAMSYLRGPLTRDQIKLVMSDAKIEQPAAAGPVAAPAAGDQTGARPALSPDVPQFFVPARSLPSNTPLTYQPQLLGVARVHYESKKSDVDSTETLVATFPVTEAAVPVDWEGGNLVELDPKDLEKTPAGEASYRPLAAAGADADNYSGWEKDFKDWVYSTQRLSLFRSPTLKLTSDPGEAEGAFRLRLGQAAREARDEAVEKLRKKYAPKLTTLEDRVRRAEQAVEREKAQAVSQGTQTAISIGATLIGAFVGRKAISATTLGRATTAARGVGRTAREREDIGRAEESLEALQGRLADLEAEFQTETDELEAKFDPTAEDLETIELKPKKTNISVDTLVLAWVPEGPVAGG